MVFWGFFWVVFLLPTLAAGDSGGRGRQRRPPDCLQRGVSLRGGREGGAQGAHRDERRDDLGGERGRGGRTRRPLQVPGLHHHGPE